MLFPITFSIPEEKISSNTDNIIKEKVLSSLIPGDTSTYTAKDLVIQNYWMITIRLMI